MRERSKYEDVPATAESVASLSGPIIDALIRRKKAVSFTSCPFGTNVV